MLERLIPASTVKGEVSVRGGSVSRNRFAEGIAVAFLPKPSFLRGLLALCYLAQARFEENDTAGPGMTH